MFNLFCLPDFLGVIKDFFFCAQNNHYTYWWPWQCCQNNQLVQLCLDQERHNIQGYWYLSPSINPYPIRGSDYVHHIGLLNKLHKLTSLSLSFGLTYIHRFGEFVVPLQKAYIFLETEFHLRESKLHLLDNWEVFFFLIVSKILRSASVIGQARNPIILHWPRL